MMVAPIPENESARIERLRLYGILDTPAEEAFDRIARLASEILDTPIAVISLVDEGRQWFKAKVGLDATETSRDVAFCAHAILGTDVYVVNDASKHQNFHDNPLVTGGPKIRFYAGAPITTTDGLALGTVCAIDSKPHNPTPRQLALLRDLSALAVNELELRAAGREALQEVAERRQIDQFKTGFVSTVSHEIRTPLTSILGGLGLVNSGALGEVPESISEVLTIAERNSTLLLCLINDLLDSAKLDAGQMEFHMHDINLREVANEAIENLRDYFREKKVAVSCIAGDKVTVFADKSRLSQVMNNLVSNAVKFSPENSRVDIDIKVHAETATVSVRDYGNGIPEAIRPRMFQKFVQGHGAGKSENSGTGLGLNIAKAIVERHGGRIAFETMTGTGTRFYFDLPLRG